MPLCIFWLFPLIWASGFLEAFFPFFLFFHLARPASVQISLSFKNKLASHHPHHHQHHLYFTLVPFSSLCGLGCSSTCGTRRSVIVGDVANLMNWFCHIIPAERWMPPNTRAEQRLKWQSGAGLIIIAFHRRVLISGFNTRVWSGSKHNNTHTQREKKRRKSKSEVDCIKKKTLYQLLFSCCVFIFLLFFILTLHSGREKSPSVPIKQVQPEGEKVFLFFF